MSYCRLPSRVWPPLAVLLLVFVLVLLGPLGCRGNGETVPAANDHNGQPELDAAELAQRLASPELHVREDAANRVSRLGTSGQRDVLDHLEQGGLGVAARLSRRLAERAIDRAMPALGARWYAVPTAEPISDGERHDRLVRTVAALLAAQEYTEAFELCRTRLAGPYPDDIEQRLATLQRQAEQGLADAD